MGTVSDNLSDRFAVVNITNLNQITKTGWYSGGNITQINQYLHGGWNIINATVQSDKSARISVFNKKGLVLEINRDGDSSYTYFSVALKSDLTDAATYNPMIVYDGSKTVAAFCQSVKSGTTAVVYVSSNYDAKTTGMPDKGAYYITVYKSSISGYGFFDAIAPEKHYSCTENNGKVSGWT